LAENIRTSGDPSLLYESSSTIIIKIHVVVEERSELPNFDHGGIKKNFQSQNMNFNIEIVWIKDRQVEASGVRS